ncbi:hypothetical protein SAY86_003062 [Trapa natans]|uniref:RING-type domain-containing protein n=1 Tax=Trapa natans TaxID=22666 RepID=A0AAN7LE90_TRANT|nr:hypothetical protein SAY86_003062 [Trapa natans]
MTKHQGVRVRREVIATYITCPLCNKLIRNATTISECLHTFCRKCIYNKITDEELERCPICHIDLGCVPLDKLRPDHILQDLRAKIFPFKGRKVNATLQPITNLPARRKERSLSSLVVNVPKASSQSVINCKRTKYATRKAVASQGSSFIRKHIKEEVSTEECLGSSSSLETVEKFTGNIQQGHFGELSQANGGQIRETTNGTWEKKADLWKPLHDLVEAANQTKSFKPSSKGFDASHAQGNHQPLRNKMKGSKLKTKVDNSKSKFDPAPSQVIKPKRLWRARPKRESSSGESHISLKAVLKAAGAIRDPRTGPIWFSLVASDEQEGHEPLPQVSAGYLRIKDGSLPVSYIQKYLMQKLHLNSETEVEIKCLGQTVLPSLLLHNLVDLWLQTASTSHRVPATIGSSAKDFVMVLAYSRKILDC